MLFKRPQLASSWVILNSKSFHWLKFLWGWALRISGEEMLPWEWAPQEPWASWKLNSTWKAHWGQAVKEIQIICLMSRQTFPSYFHCISRGIIQISPARFLLLVCALPTVVVIPASPCPLRKFMVCIFLCMVLLRCLKNVPVSKALIYHSLEKINFCLLPASLC